MTLLGNVNCLALVLAAISLLHPFAVMVGLAGVHKCGLHSGTVAVIVLIIRIAAIVSL